MASTKLLLDSPSRRPKYGRRREDIITALICLLPAGLVFGVFNIYPILYSGYLSLLEWDGLKPERVFVGLRNYSDLFSSPEFWNSLWVTLYYMAGVTAFGLAAGLLVALALNSGLRGRAGLRALYFLPVVTATVAAAVVWKYLFEPTSGIINLWLRGLGLPAPGWLASPVWAMPAIILVGVWKRLGFNMVVYLAGLQAVPRDYHDAAQVDGAGAWARFRYITLPLLAPVTALLLVMSVIDAFLVFDQIYVMTNGGPLGSTDVVGLLLYRQAFRYFDVGMASAVGWVIFAIVFAFTLVQWRLTGFGAQEAR